VTCTAHLLPVLSPVNVTQAVLRFPLVNINKGQGHSGIPCSYACPANSGNCNGEWRVPYIRRRLYPSNSLPGSYLVPRSICKGHKSIIYAPWYLGRFTREAISELDESLRIRRDTSYAGGSYVVDILVRPVQNYKMHTLMSGPLLQCNIWCNERCNHFLIAF